MNIRLGAVLPSVKPKWVLAAVLNDMEEDFNLLSLEATKTLNFWGYAVEARVQTQTDLLPLWQISCTCFLYVNKKRSSLLTFILCGRDLFRLRAS